MVDARNFADEVNALAMGSKPEIEEDHLSEITPDYARVQIPLTSKWKLRIAADYLRTLAFCLDQLSRRTDRKDSSALFEAWAEIQSTNRKLSQATKSGKADKN
jgi:hypothetical protein